MPAVCNCPKCGVTIPDPMAATCPACGSPLVFRPIMPVWVALPIQLAIGTTFMLVFRFPKFMIAFMWIAMLIGTPLAVFVRRKPLQPPAPPRPLARPVMFRVSGLALALCAFALLAVVLLGSVMVYDAVTNWRDYRGQPYHRTDFEVAQTHYEKVFRGHATYATGTVEGKPESMGLVPYLHMQPHSEGELDSLVPQGTVIPVYYFPNIKGRARVLFDESDVPPAEASRLLAIKRANYGLAMLGILAILIFLLRRVQAGCYADPEPPAAFAASTRG